MFNSPLRETAVLAAAIIVRLAFVACFFSEVLSVGFEVTFAFVLVSLKTLVVGGPLCVIVATRRASLYNSCNPEGLFVYLKSFSIR